MSAIGLLLNAGLALVKLLAGLLGNSNALVADAVESLADIFGSLVVWSGLRISARPADANHPYGHGKAEPLAALLVAMMLVGAGLGIAVQSIREISTPHPSPKAYTLGVLVGVVLVKELLFRYARRAARESASTALLADAWHHRSDALTSLAAAVGITIALLGGPGYAVADDWAALFAAGLILFNAYRLMRPPLHELMDAEPTEVVGQARAIAERVAGVDATEKIFARKHGTGFWIDMHVEVDPEMTVERAHAVAHDVKDAVCGAMPRVANVLVHIEPHGQTQPRSEDITASNR